MNKKCDGKPARNIEIEVEYMNNNIKGNAFVKRAKVKTPQDAFIT